MTLTEMQKEYLRNRSIKDSTTRSRYDFKMKLKLSKIISDVQDALLILEGLPPHISCQSFDEKQIRHVQQLADELGLAIKKQAAYTEYMGKHELRTPADHP